MKPASSASFLIVLAGVLTSCSVAPYAGIDPSRYRSAEVDWGRAQAITGIFDAIVKRYRSDPGEELKATRYISQSVSGPRLFRANFSPHCDQKEGRPPA